MVDVAAMEALSLKEQALDQLVNSIRDHKARAEAEKDPAKKKDKIKAVTQLRDQLGTLVTSLIPHMFLEATLKSIHFVGGDRIGFIVYECKQCDTGIYVTRNSALNVLVAYRYKLSSKIFHATPCLAKIDMSVFDSVKHMFCA